MDGIVTVAYGSGGAEFNVFGIIWETSAYSDAICVIGAVIECIGFINVFPCSQSVCCLSGSVVVRIGPARALKNDNDGQSIVVI